jgi:hypothetical protein
VNEVIERVAPELPGRGAARFRGDQLAISETGAMHVASG